MLDLLNIRDLTKRDVIVICSGLALGCIFGLAQMGFWCLMVPMIAGFVLVPLIRVIEYYLALRVSATTIAKVVDCTTAIHRVRRRHAPTEEYVIFRPVVEFETKDGPVRLDYAVFRKDRLFVVGEEYEICYSVKDPKIFYFTCRKNEPGKRYLLTFGVWVLLIGIMVAELLRS